MGEEQFLLIKGKIQQDDVSILNLYAPNAWETTFVSKKNPHCWGILFSGVWLLFMLHLFNSLKLSKTLDGPNKKMNSQ